MKEAVGGVYLEVFVDCPYCDTRLALTPSNYQEVDLFEGVEIEEEKRCVKCGKEFILKKFEYQ